MSGEIGLAISKGLQKSAKTIVDKGSNFNKHLDDLIKKGEIDEIGKGRFLETLAKEETKQVKIK